MILKRACQVNYVRFDQLENFIFGEGNTTFNSSITLASLAECLQRLLSLPEAQAETLARYLVREGKSIEESRITPKTKVLQCKVITCLQQNINQHCAGVQVFSKKKEGKMKVILGNLLAEKAHFASFDELRQSLLSAKVEKETLECAYVYCLRMSGSLNQQISASVLADFVEECK